MRTVREPEHTYLPGSTCEPVARVHNRAVRLRLIDLSRDHHRPFSGMLTAAAAVRVLWAITFRDSLLETALRAAT